MGLATLKQTSKQLKIKEEELEELVELGVIKPPAYCYPALFGDGKAIAFYPEQVAEQVKAAKSIPKPGPAPKPEPEPEEDEEEGEEKEEPDTDPEPKAPNAKELAKKKAEEKKMLAAEEEKEKK